MESDVAVNTTRRAFNGWDTADVLPLLRREKVFSRVPSSMEASRLPIMKYHLSLCLVFHFSFFFPQYISPFSPDIRKTQKYSSCSIAFTFCGALIRAVYVHKKMRQIGNFINSLKAAALPMLVQFLNSGINVFYKLAANEGMSLRVIIAYRLLIATVVSSPFALFLEWKSWETLTWTICFPAFLCGLFGGSLAQNLYLQSMVYTSATFVSAINNLVPVFTLVTAVFFRLETLKLGTVAGKAKLMGILIGIGGAVILTLYKGAEINIWPTNINLLHHGQVSAHPGRSHPGTSTFILVAFLALLSCVSLSFWMIIQAKLGVTFPYMFSSSVLMCGIGSIQSVVITLCTEKDWSRWKLDWNIGLLTVDYTVCIP